MEGSLDTYQSMRDFGQTPEPAGQVAASDGAPRFVVQEHHARRLHWDFRLEHEGVMVSWAVPKGIPEDPKVNHLAVHTEDHPISYNDFEGEIPTGNYGAGTVKRWDYGTYECHEWEPGKVVVTLHGERVRGRHALFRTKGDQWMIHRMDPPEDREREPMPEGVLPMRATRADLPSNEDGWSFEIRWSGVRVIVPVDGGRSRLLRNGTDDISALFPELRPLGNELGARAVLLDGVLSVLDDQGVPHAERLAKRLEPASDSTVRRRARDQPAALVLFDVLYAEGRVTMSLPCSERRQRLEGLALSGPTWQVPSAHVGNGTALLEAARSRGLSGLIAKRLDSVYEPGVDSPAWLDVRP
jgi:bifunctional non-homologous end joining protein LigD